MSLSPQNHGDNWQPAPHLLSP